tara:strand:+ start:1782 stop:1901 length:120 start_codon:yes stop_codon:yes gene_type:complete
MINWTNKNDGEIEVESKQEEECPTRRQERHDLNRDTNAP